jgi:hypothetical protein
VKTVEQNYLEKLGVTDYPAAYYRSKNSRWAPKLIEQFEDDGLGRYGSSALSPYRVRPSWALNPKIGKWKPATEKRSNFKDNIDDEY